MGGEEKKVPQKKENQNELKNEKKCQPKFTTFVNRWIRRDKKGTPISAPSIHIDALVGANVIKNKAWNKSQLIR
jgi:hypothetical protein